MAGFISVNGEITDADKARIPALDRGFLFGDNVFETFVGFGDQILDLKPHLSRLRYSAEELGMTIPWSDEELAFELIALAQHLGAPKANIRLVVTRGSGMGLKVGPDIRPNKVIYCFPAKQEPESVYREGIALKRKALTYTDRGANPKTGNYLKSITALQQAEREGYQDVLWSNAAEELTEATTANIFFIGREGDLVEIATPPATSGLLLGITRATITRLLRESQIPVTERIIYVDELPRFDEAFLCSTVRGLVPVNRIDQHKLKTTRPNSVFRHIDRLYGSWVASELGYRVDWNTGARLT